MPLLPSVIDSYANHYCLWTNVRIHPESWPPEYHPVLHIFATPLELPVEPKTILWSTFNCGKALSLRAHFILSNNQHPSTAKSGD